MKSYISYLMVIFLSSSSAFSQNTDLGIFTSHNDVGTMKIPGNISYNSENQQYTIGGSGKNIWLGNDDFHFAWKKLSGNFILNAQLQFKGKGTDLHRKMGWMVRHSLAPNAPYVDATVHGDGLTALQYRKTTDGTTDEIKASITAADVIQLERLGNLFIMSVAKLGEPMQESARLELNIGDEVYLGIFICSHNEDVFEEAVFSNVRISIPAKDNFVAYKEYSGSRLEILDVESGLRKVIYETPEPIEAPNWTKDNSKLIYNSRGILYNFPFHTLKPDILNTSYAKNNNNDHVLSFDGKFIGISNHGTQTAAGGSSLIHIVSVEGGVPTQITPIGPSYLHGWSPDGKTLVYCAERNKKYDVYTVSVKGGSEKQLTTAEGLDDGPEYSPDGKYIYFNSTRSGTMQIWRMKPDGSKQEPVTNDEYNNWFAHISPDGKWIAFLTFTQEVKPDDHPHYKRVMIRIIPVDKNIKPRVLAYVYGGQGTINVPSWSPDSKKIAFVSYTFPDDYYRVK